MGRLDGKQPVMQGLVSVLLEVMSQQPAVTAAALPTQQSQLREFKQARRS